MLLRTERYVATLSRVTEKWWPACANVGSAYTLLHVYLWLSLVPSHWGQARLRVWEMIQVGPRVASWLLPVLRLCSRGVEAAELASLNRAVRNSSGQNTPVKCHEETWLCNAFGGARGLMLKRYTRK